jgi:hypothetical protein
VRLNERPAIEAMLTTAPPEPRVRCGTAAWVQKNTPSRLTDIV